jgi:hypothetical protein
MLYTTAHTFAVSILSAVTPTVRTPLLLQQLAASVSSFLCPLCILSNVPPHATLSNCGICHLGVCIQRQHHGYTGRQHKSCNSDLQRVIHAAVWKGYNLKVAHVKEQQRVEIIIKHVWHCLKTSICELI